MNSASVVVCPDLSARFLAEEFGDCFGRIAFNDQSFLLRSRFTLSGFRFFLLGHLLILSHCIHLVPQPGVGPGRPKSRECKSHLSANSSTGGPQAIGPFSAALRYLSRHNLERNILIAKLWMFPRVIDLPILPFAFNFLRIVSKATQNFVDRGQAASDLPANSTLPQLAGAWHYVPLALLTIAGIVWLLGRRHNQPNVQQSQLVQSSRGVVQPGLLTLSALQGQAPIVSFDGRQFFRVAYHSPLTAEVENNIKLIAEQNQPGDHESFLARFIGVGVVSYLHDITWAYIFKGQLFMLADLNHRNGSMPLSVAKEHYDKAVLENPKFYNDYSFQQWMNYVYGEQLVIKHPSDMLEITHRGKDLLKYLAHWGRDFNVKAG